MKSTRKTKSKGSTKRAGRRAEPVKSGKQAVSKAARKPVRKKALIDGRMPSLLAVKQVLQPISRKRRSASIPEIGAPSGRSLPTNVNNRPPATLRVAMRAGQPSFSNRSTARSAPFNPSLPVDGSLIIAGELRDQFNGLVVMIESIPAGPPGPQGEQGIQGEQGNPGPPFAQAVIDSVTTLPAYEQAWVTSSFDGTYVHFSFGIPHGYEGSQGQQGAQGEQGVQGVQGPPFAQAVIDGVTTLNPGQPATVSCWFDGSNVHFTFGIPRGADGQQGPPGEQGIQGIQGEQGPQGPPGEVTAAQLSSAISGTAVNPINVSPLYISISDPPTQSEVQQILSRMNDLISALYRAP